MGSSSSSPRTRKLDPSLVDLIQTEVEIDWNREVSILAAWEADDDSAVILYHQARDDIADRIMGRVFRMGPKIADGTPIGAASDAALVLAEPPGAMVDTAVFDENGIMWFGLGSSRPPKLPSHVISLLSKPAPGSDPFHQPW